MKTDWYSGLGRAFQLERTQAGKGGAGEVCQVVGVLEPGGKRVEQGQGGACEGWLPGGRRRGLQASQRALQGSVEGF